MITMTMMMMVVMMMLRMMMTIMWMDDGEDDGDDDGDSGDDGAAEDDDGDNVDDDGYDNGDNLDAQLSYDTHIIDSSMIWCCLVTKVAGQRGAPPILVESIGRSLATSSSARVLRITRRPASLADPSLRAIQPKISCSLAGRPCRPTPRSEGVSPRSAWRFGARRGAPRQPRTSPYHARCCAKLGAHCLAFSVVGLFLQRESISVWGKPRGIVPGVALLEHQKCFLCLALASCNSGAVGLTRGGPPEKGTRPHRVFSTFLWRCSAR